MSSLAERALSPLDAARGTILRRLAAGPTRSIVLARNLRVPIGLSVHALAAFAIAVAIPSLSLVVAPILLGVPHVASDVRYLVLRRQLPSAWPLATALFAAILFGLRLLPALDPLAPDRVFLEHAVASAWVLFGAILGIAKGGLRKGAALALTGVGMIAALALAEPYSFRLILGHAHNLAAIAIWLLVFRPRLRTAWLPVLLIFLGGACLASGALYGFTIRHGILSAFGLHLFVAADWLAPGVPDPQAVGLASSFAFLQSVHYGIWLWAIPQDEAKTDRMPTFRMTWRALRRDFHPVGLALVSLIVVLVIAAGASNPIRTQMLILSLGGFHAWLELATLALLIACGGLPKRSNAGAGA